MGTVIGVVVFVVGLLLSVAWHELGHFIPAKAFKVPVRQFFVGFGPTAWSTKRGETEYGIKWLPLGGFIRMVGMYRPKPIKEPTRRGWMQRIAAEAREVSTEEMEPGEDARAFYRLSVPKKLTVMLGGPAMNLILAVALFTIAFCGIGQVQVTSGISQTTANGPAAAAGLQSGDTITAWDGTPVSSGEDVIAAIGATKGSSAKVDIVRNGVPQELTITPTRQDVKNADGQVTGTKLVIGITLATANVPQPISAVGGLMGEAIGGSIKVIATLPVQVFNTAQTVVEGGERDPNGPLSVVAVGQIAGAIGSESASFTQKLGGLLSLLASMNLALCLFNLIPLLPLDGGHVVGALYEGVRRTWAKLRRRADVGAADTARAMPLAYGVFGVLILMSLVLIIADVVSPVKLG